MSAADEDYVVELGVAVAAPVEAADHHLREEIPAFVVLGASLVVGQQQQKSAVVAEGR